MKNSVSGRLTFCMVLVFLAGLSATVYSKSETTPAAPETGKTAPPPEMKMSEAERNQISGQIQEFKKLEIRIIVLQQMINEQAAVLHQKQALFCDSHKLDVEKMRKGLYQFDSKTGTFSEAQVTAKV